MITLLVVLGLLNGGYMLADGITVLIRRRYIGPDKPGPWAMLFLNLGIDVFKLGPLFITFGVAWLTFAIGIISDQQWTISLGIVLSFLTLWYIPFGTTVSLIVLALSILSSLG